MTNASAQTRPAGASPRNPACAYRISVEGARFYQTLRYYWTVCRAEKPEEMISWGNAPSRQAAEQDAQNEVTDLVAGFQ
jgi:hypothetical protein